MFLSCPVFTESRDRANTAVEAFGLKLDLSVLAAIPPPTFDAVRTAALCAATAELLADVRAVIRL